MQQYTTVFDITHKGFDLWFPAFGLIIILGSVLVIRERRAGYWWAYLGIVIGLLWIPLTFSSMHSAYGACRTAYENGHYSIAEGYVADFHPMPFEGHQDECFTVQGVRFCYSDYMLVCGFNNTSSHGGPVRSGLPVRVTYAGENIFKLEIRSDSAPSSAEVRKREIRVIGRYVISFWPILAILLGLKFIIWLYNRLRPIAS